MRRFVLDEWLWADLQGENGEEAQRQSFQLLLEIYERCDQVVTVEGSAFLKKFYDLCEKAGPGDPRRSIVRDFKDRFLLNSEKLIRLREEELPAVPTEIADAIEDKDRYLVRSYIAAQAKLVVTTDNPLLETLRNSRINCLDREGFLSHYLGGASA